MFEKFIEKLSGEDTGFYLKIKYSRYGGIVNIGKLSFEECVINFWRTGKIETGYVQGLLFGPNNSQVPILMKKIFDALKFYENYKNKFKYVDIVFQPVLSAMRFAEKTDFTLGYVLNDDMEADRNIVYVNLEEIESMEKYRAGIIDSYKLQNVSDEQIQSSIRTFDERIRENFISTFSNILTHELTHLWYYKQSEALEAEKKIRSLFSSFIKPEKFDPKMYKSFEERVFAKIKDNTCSLMEREELIDFLKKFYLIIRQRLEELSYRLVTEGMANFVQSYVNGTYNYEQQIKFDAKRSAIQIRIEFENVLNYFSLVANFIFSSAEDFSKMIEKQKVEEIGEENEIEKKMIDLLDLHEKYCDSIFSFCDSLYSIYPYRLGPIIPATLFESGMQIKEIGNLNPREIIKEYEEFCVSNGIRPFVSDNILSESNADFNIAEAGAQFNALRKKLGITSLPQK